VRGDVAVGFRVLGSGLATVELELSTDGGQRWQVASVASASSLTQLAAGPAPGVDHAVVWDSRALQAFEPSVLLRVTAVGGGSATSAPVAVDNEAVSTHTTLNRRPFLQATTPSETLVLWRTDAQTNDVVEYGLTPALGLSAGNPQAQGVDHQARLTGLTPGAPFYYRVAPAGGALTQRVASRAAPAANVDQFRFVVVGDSGMNNPVQVEIADRMAAEDADLFLVTGDVVYPAGGIGAAVSEYNARFFRPYEAMLERIPAFPVVGNHDMYGLLAQPFKDTFVLPDNGQGALLNELFYSFEWGDCKFIALETNFLHRVPIGPHVTWLNNELANNTKKWLIVYFHTPLYSAGDHGDNTWLQLSLGSVLEHGDVDLVLTGHDHNYERTLPLKRYNTDPAYPGLVHIVTGGGGANLRDVNPTPNTAVAIKEHHYMRIRIDGDWLYGDAVNPQGQVIDTFTIRDQ
jgi:acid phosphatase type 7